MMAKKMPPMRSLARLMHVTSMSRQPMLPKIPRLSGSFEDSERPYTPRRALMYVPGSDERKLLKIPQIQADCICLDCEDGVAYGDAKVVARNNIRKILTGNMKIDFGRSEKTVRINSISSGLCHTDVETIFGGLEPEQAPSAIHLPKVDDPEQLREFSYIFTQSFAHVSPKIGLIMFVESGRSLIQLSEICTEAEKLKGKSPLVPEALVFGSDDFVADIGATRTENAIELLYARQKVVVTAKAFGLQAIDLVHIDFKDLEGLKKYAESGARMGFTGKQVIHPGQVKIVHEAFKPSEEKIEWATSLIKEFKKHESGGKGAFVYRGSMIDAPLVKQAENIVQMANKIID